MKIPNPDEQGKLLQERVAHPARPPTHTGNPRTTQGKATRASRLPNRFSLP